MLLHPIDLHAITSDSMTPRMIFIEEREEVKEHAEFSWILKCITTMARLGRLAQFKEKSEKLKEVPLGLYVYPVLQAADILLYKTTHVPVGEDQSQHIQLAQDLQRVFNHTYKSEVLVRPTALISDGPASRVKSLRDPAKKMSKSDPDPRSYIGLTDPPELITNKFRKALTDFTSEVSFDPENRASVSNLILIESLSTGLTPDEICERNSNIDTGKYKLVVADSVIEMLRPIQNNYHRLINEKGYLISVLRDGAERARTVANKTLSEVKKVVGLSLEY
ncbi:hypothetical protein QYM36_010056 [Artemia franciscana]|uniref:tryptophan--tRNA ligase n=1 Tax=Artemia franciscana TaxID=6661 RepID=A0AA88HQL0_ARTSF|nr:hypothetical protein QYM36_010056 [Artemia franciscana]